MGSTYTNVTLIGTTLERVRANCDGPAFAAEAGDVVVLFAEVDEETGPTTAEQLTRVLDCVALTVGVFDDDVLMFEVHDHGASAGGGALPDPAAYFGLEAGELPGMGGEPDTVPLDASALVTAIGRGDAARVRGALDGDFVFASQRHRELVAALDLPEFAAAWGYRYLEEDLGSFTGPPLVRFGGA